MASVSTANTRIWDGALLIEALGNQSSPAWQNGKNITVGTKCSANNKIYISCNSGITGSVAPAHTQGTAMDNTVQWLFLSGDRANNGINSNLYISLGGTKAWTDEANPPEPKRDDNSLAEYRKDILTLVKLDSSNARLAIKNIPYVSGVVYDKYDGSKDIEDITSYTNPFYIIVNNELIYKCIENGNGAVSTFMPTTKDIGFTYSNTGDGYVWKYMGSVNPSDMTMFATPDYIPVTIKTFDDGSDQWKIQQSAKAGSISSYNKLEQKGLFTDYPTKDVKVEIVGSGVDATGTVTIDATGNLTQIISTNGGKLYDKNTFALIGYKDELGSGANLTINTTDITGGKITNVTTISGGTKYKNATLFVVGDGTGAKLSATVNAVTGTIDNVLIDNQGSGYTWAKVYVVAGSDAAIAKAILSPANGHGSNILVELYARTLLFSANISSSMKPYILEGTESGYRRIMLIAGAEGKTVKNAELMTGSKHPKYGTTLNDYDTNTGYILYVNNVTLISRALNQGEIMKIPMVI